MLLNENQIIAELNDLGATGNAKIKGDALWVQREENADWLRVGEVADAKEAKTLIAEHFNA